VRKPPKAEKKPKDRSRELAAFREAGQVVLDLIGQPGGVAADDFRLVEVFAELVAAARSKGALPASAGADQEAFERSPAFEAERRARTVAQALREAKSLARRLVEVQENERRSIARELHDEAGQALASLRYGLRLLEREIDEGGSATERVAELMQRTDAVIDSLHRLVADLRPASLDHLGLEAALRQYSRSAGSKFGLEVRFKARGFGSERLPQVVETALYRVVQEAMVNVVRHARATRVDVLLERHGERVLVMIEDDGVGFEPDRVGSGSHFGLLGLQERAEALGGTLVVESTPGTGTTIVVEVASADPHPDR
jgi:signal transduction histidine kinase